MNRFLLAALTVLVIIMFQLSFQNLRDRVKAHNPALIDERNVFLHVSTVVVFILTVETFFGVIYAS